MRYWIAMRMRWVVWGAALVAGVGLGVGVALATRTSGNAAPPSVSDPQAAANPNLDPGAPLSGTAPGFTLTDQFGRKVSLASFRGKVVVLTFNDPQCTTICPLTTTALVRAKALLGAAGRNVQLLGVGANPLATQVKWVKAYSVAHGMLHKWLFLTGALPQLKRVWKAYGIEAAVVRGAIDHTPATYILDARGRESRLFMTQMAYSSVPQLAEELARSVAALLPGRPTVRDTTSLAAISLLGPKRNVTLPRAGGGAVRLGPGTGPHLLLFFDTWAAELTNVRARIDALNGYATYAKKHDLPPLVAVDEGGVEPSAQALPRLLHSLPRPLSFPVAIDDSGRVADGYRVEDSPWLELVSGSGRFVFYRDLAATGWPSARWLRGHVRAGMARKSR
jgi:cytochrome oxidase Cu insertion factor (SCO1/SenC/PrrC family)